MSTLRSNVDVRSPTYLANRDAMLQHISHMDDLIAKAIDGGGERYQQRHHDRGRLLVRERIELLVDQDSPFLELSPTAAAGTEFAVGAALVTGIGTISGTECVILASDPTVRGGSMNPITVTKILRALAICRENRLPMVYLVESGGGRSSAPARSVLAGWRSVPGHHCAVSSRHPDDLARVRQLDSWRRVLARYE